MQVRVPQSLRHRLLPTVVKLAPAVLLRENIPIIPRLPTTLRMKFLVPLTDRRRWMKRPVELLLIPPDISITVMMFISIMLASRKSHYSTTYSMAAMTTVEPSRSGRVRDISRCRALTLPAQQSTTLLRPRELKHPTGRPRTLPNTRWCTPYRKFRATQVTNRARVATKTRDNIHSLTSISIKGRTLSPVIL